MHGFNTIIIYIDNFDHIYIYLTSCFLGEWVLTTLQVAELSFDAVVKSFGLTKGLVSDHDLHLTSLLWKSLEVDG